MKPVSLGPGIILLALAVSLLAYSCAGSRLPAETSDKERAKVPSAIDGSGKIEISQTGREWEQILREAKKEGKVVIYSTMGSNVRNAIIEGFKKKYEGITLEVVVGRGGEVAQKIMRERSAGLFTADIYSGGATTIFTVLKPAGVFEPISDYLILPEVKDPQRWFQGELPFADREKKFIIAFSATPSSGYIIKNSQLTKQLEFSEYAHLLNPLFKGKLVFDDITVAGKGLRWFGVTLTYAPIGVDFMKRLAGQEPVLTRDRRQMVEWVARGKYWVGIGAETAAIEEFIAAGSPLTKVKLKEDADHVSAGSATAAVLKGAPHPKAAKIFINWLLSKEGQAVYSAASTDHSSRNDGPTEHLSADEIRIPGRSYIMMDKEDFLVKQAEHARVAQEIFGHLIR